MRIIFLSAAVLFLTTQAVKLQQASAVTVHQQVENSELALLTAKGISKEEWDILFDALRAKVSPSKEMTKEEFVSVISGWMDDHWPAKYGPRPSDDHLGMIFTHYLDADGNGTVSAGELETAIKGLSRG